MFPVYAGVILQVNGHAIKDNGVPRVFGGDPVGKLRHLKCAAVFPVYAGVILTVNAKFSALTGVPRVCGGDP